MTNATPCDWNHIGSPSTGHNGSPSGRVTGDDGIGLRPEDMEKVGKPFWRADHHPLVHYNTSGTGLSLFLAKQILALQHGELICYGEPDLGSTFSFTLPTPT